MKKQNWILQQQMEQRTLQAKLVNVWGRSTNIYFKSLDRTHIDRVITRESGFLDNIECGMWFNSIVVSIFTMSSL